MKKNKRENNLKEVRRREVKIKVAKISRADKRVVQNIKIKAIENPMKMKGKRNLKLRARNLYQFQYKKACSQRAKYQFLAP